MLPPLKVFQFNSTELHFSVQYSVMEMMWILWYVYMTICITVFSDLTCKHVDKPKNGTICILHVGWWFLRQLNPHLE